MRYDNPYDRRFRGEAFNAYQPYWQAFEAPEPYRGPRNRGPAWGLGGDPGAYGTPLASPRPLRFGGGGGRPGRAPVPGRPAPRRAPILRARDIMTEDPEAVTREATLQHVAERMCELDVGIIPVVTDYESGLLHGVVTDRDIVVRAVARGADMQKTTVGEIMTEKVEAVDEGAEIPEIFAIMKRERVRRVPVVDEAGRLVGIIAQADLAVDYAGVDEERGLEVEEVLERISEPAKPAPWLGRGYDGEWRGGGGFREAEEELRARVRSGFDRVRRRARDLLDRGYDQDWR